MVSFIAVILSLTMDSSFLEIEGNNSFTSCEKERFANCFSASTGCVNFTFILFIFFIYMIDVA